MKRKILGIGSVALASIALFLLISTPYYPPLGGLMLKKIGLGTWREEAEGFYSIMMYSAIFICIGFIGMAEYLYSEYPKTRNKGKWLVLGTTIVLVMVSNQSVKMIKGLQPGLKAIQFVYDEGRFSYQYEGEKVVKAGGELTFKNYSNTSRSFYVKYIPDERVSDQFLVKELIGYEGETGRPKLIQIEPKSKIRIQVDFDKNQVLSNEDRERRGGGSRSIQTVIIYNDEEQVEFTEDDFMGVIK